MSRPAAFLTQCEFCENMKEEFGITDTKTEKPKLTLTGKIILGVTGATFATMCAVTIPFISPALRRVCLPYVPATTQQVNNVIKLLEGRSGSLVDLGSGDGRIVIEAAKLGFKAVGVELNPWLVWYSRVKAWREGVSSNTKFVKRDLWKFDLSKYDNVVIFGVEQMMAQLEGKLNKEISEDSQVIACRFQLPNWQPCRTLDSGIDTVWLYKNQRLHNSR